LKNPAAAPTSSATPEDAQMPQILVFWVAITLGQVPCASVRCGVCLRAV
jgi:hypothetical protein